MTVLPFIGSMVLGAIIGSFLSMLIPRLHDGKKGIVAGRSQCPHCDHILGVPDLIPLLSYCWLRGRCRHCGKPIALWYPLTELSTVLLFGALYLSSPTETQFWWLMPLFAVLVFIFFYDLRYKEIHDGVLLPGIVYGLIATTAIGDLRSSLIGAAIGAAFFGLQYLLSRGRWVGSGDIRIGAFIGILLGWQGTLVSLLVSYILGSCIGVVLLATGKADAKTALPLGPFLVLGTLLSFFWGDQLLAFYLNL